MDNIVLSVPSFQGDHGRIMGSNTLGIYWRRYPCRKGKKTLDVRVQIMLSQEVVEETLLGVNGLAGLVQLCVTG